MDVAVVVRAKVAERARMYCMFDSLAVAAAADSGGGRLSQVE